jgi:hypothetical protein
MLALSYQWRLPMKQLRTKLGLLVGVFIVAALLASSLAQAGVAPP